MAATDGGDKEVADNLPFVLQVFPGKRNGKKPHGGSYMPLGNNGGANNSGPKNNEQKQQNNNNTNKGCTPGGRGLGRGGGQGRKDGSGGGKGRGGGGKGGRRNQS